MKTNRSNADRITKSGRGRPRSVDFEQYAKAILAIKGREPTIDELCASLGISKATFYNHVPGYQALVELAGEVIVNQIEIPSADDFNHWSEWCIKLVQNMRRTFEDYPIYLKQLTARSNHVGMLEKALEALTQLGMDVDTALHSFHTLSYIAVAGKKADQLGDFAQEKEMVLPRLTQAIETSDVAAPLLSQVLKSYTFSSANVFDDILLFTLEGIARRRNEELPAHIAAQMD